MDDENYEISVMIVDNQFIKELNKHYRSIDKETDVLSFPILSLKWRASGRYSNCRRGNSTWRYCNLN